MHKAPSLRTLSTSQPDGRKAQCVDRCAALDLWRGRLGGPRLLQELSPADGQGRRAAAQLGALRPPDGAHHRRQLVRRGLPTWRRKPVSRASPSCALGRLWAGPSSAVTQACLARMVFLLAAKHNSSTT